jgi:hypothetical protein
MVHSGWANRHWLVGQFGESRWGVPVGSSWVGPRSSESFEIRRITPLDGRLLWIETQNVLSETGGDETSWTGKLLAVAADGTMQPLAWCIRKRPRKRIIARPCPISGRMVPEPPPKQLTPTAPTSSYNTEHRKGAFFYILYRWCLSRLSSDSPSGGTLAVDRVTLERIMRLAHVPGWLFFVIWMVLPACHRDGAEGGDTTDTDDTDDVSDLAELERVLAFASACADESEATSIGLLFAYADFYLSRPDSNSTDVQVEAACLACFAAASDCDAFRECGEGTSGQQAVCDNADAGEELCDGDVLVGCPYDEEDTTWIKDCGAAGLSCGDAADSASCGTPTCNPTTDDESCDGALRISCEGGVNVARDCSDSSTLHCSSNGDDDWDCFPSMGGTCAIDVDGAICVGTGPSCSTDVFENSCSGHLLTSCQEDHESQYDCSEVGFNYTCGLNDDGHNACVYATDECDLETPDTCSNGVITYCANGQVAYLSCTDFGFSGCDSTGELAFCVF